MQSESQTVLRMRAFAYFKQSLAILARNFSMCLPEIAHDSFLIIPMVSSSEKQCENLEFSPEMLNSSEQRTG